MSRNGRMVLGVPAKWWVQSKDRIHKTLIILSYQVRKGADDWKGVNLHSHLTLNTNISSLSIPLVIFDGKLRQVVLDSERLYNRDLLLLSDRPQ